MDVRFAELSTSPENSIFNVVFFPDRVYHAQYLNATRSPRYRYNVREVRSKHDAQVLKGEVFLDDQKLCNFLRIEYRASRLVEVAREKGRFLRQQLVAWVNLIPEGSPAVQDFVKLSYCPWVDAYQVEIWETLEVPESQFHDVKVLDLMGRDGSITRVPSFSGALKDLKKLKTVEIAFRENTRDYPSGYTISNDQAAWDNFYDRNIQVPNTQDPSNNQNTEKSANYQISFQRAFFIEDVSKVLPVRYRNAMMNDGDLLRRDDNIIEMRWVLQQEFGSALVFFHEVTIPPRTIEGTHRHIGSEELYYITQGEGFAYMGAGDDPSLNAPGPGGDGQPRFELVERNIYGLDPEMCHKVPVKPGSVIFTKSGGIHGIENPSPDTPLKFVAFLYHST